MLDASNTPAAITAADTASNRVVPALPGATNAGAGIMSHVADVATNSEVSGHQGISTPPTPVCGALDRGPAPTATVASIAHPAPHQPRLATEEAPSRAATTRTSPLALVRAFYGAHVEALATAAELLGGASALGRHYRLVADLRRGRLTDGQLMRAVQRVHDLLSLEAVGDPDREEAGLFALLDPGSDVVHDLCRLTDVVGDLLAELRRAVARRAADGRAPALVVQQGTRERSGDGVREVTPTARAGRTARIARARAAATHLDRPDAA